MRCELPRGRALAAAALPCATLGVLCLARLPATEDPAAAQLAAGPGRPPRQGCLTYVGCTNQGFNNQREALSAALLIAAAAGLRLRVGVYRRSTHVSNASAPPPWGRLLDEERLLHAAGVEVSIDPPREGPPAPSKADQVKLDPNRPVDIDRVAAAARGAAERAAERQGCAALRLDYCNRFVLWGISASAPRRVAWGDQLLSRAVRPAPALADLAAAVLAVARRAVPAGARLHALHLRLGAVGGDYIDFPYPPLMDCADARWAGQLAPAQCGQGRVCACRRPSDPARGFVDFDWVVPRLGSVRPGDAVYVAVHPAGARSERMRKLERALRSINASAVTLAGAAEADQALAAALRRLSADELGIVDAVVCADAEGEFIASCASSLSEWVIDLRRWRGAPGARDQTKLFSAYAGAFKRCFRTRVPGRCSPGAAGRRVCKIHYLSP